MKLLIDTNIVLDVLLKREPFYQDAVKVMNLAQYDDVQEYNICFSGNRYILYCIQTDKRQNIGFKSY